MNTRTFDLPTLLSDTNSLYLRMQVLSSYAWRVDTLITQQCRALFKLLKLTPMAQTLDSEADLRNAITEGSWTEQLFGETGADAQAPMETLWTLATMRLAAHQQAEDATLLVPWSNGAPRKYTVPEIEDLFVSNGSTEPKGESLLRMQMSAERNAAKLGSGKDIKALAKKFLEARLRIERANLAGMAHRMAQQSTTLCALYSYAMQQMPGHVSNEFTALHVDIQRVLIDNAIASIDRAVATAESQPKELSFDDFCHLSIEADALKDKLKAVLASPRFNGGVAMRVVKASPPAPTAETLKAKHEEAVKARTAERLAKPKTQRPAEKMKAKVEPTPVPVTALSVAMTAALESQPNDV